jgi:TRAP-type C4-dicarboxylate transport system substrate-binding protein
MDSAMHFPTLHKFAAKALLAAALFLPASVLAQQTIKLATLAPDGSAWMRELRAAAAEVQAQTQGRVTVKFFPGGVMGSDAVVLRKIRLGQLQGGAVTGSDLDAICKDAPIYSLPFLFNTQAEVDAVRKLVDPMLADCFQKGGMRMLGLAGGGFAYLMSTRALNSREDLRSSKVWVPANDRVGEMTFRNGGITPIPLPLSDVFTALQTGLVDTVGNTHSGAVILQWHGKIKYIVDLPLSYIPAFVLVDEKAWGKLSPADQSVLLRSFNAAMNRIDANNRRENVQALAALRKGGTQVLTPSATEATRWREIGVTTTRQLEQQGAFSPAVMQAIQKQLASQRGAK